MGGARLGQVRLGYRIDSKLGEGLGATLALVGENLGREC